MPHVNLLDSNSDHHSAWQMDEVRLEPDAPLDELVSCTRAAFLDGDMLPGLPDADGAHDTVESVAEEMRAGIRVWVAHSGDGSPAGTVRAIPRDATRWQIRRLAVWPDLQGKGIARRLIRGLEQAARDEGLHRLVVWALVERGIPPFYSDLGYLTTGHFGSPDKPLSEAVMERDLHAPRAPLSYPWGTEAEPAPLTSRISWFATADATVAVLGPGTSESTRSGVAADTRYAAERVGPVRFLGGDGRLGGEPADFRERIAAADAADGDLLTYHRECRDVPEFTMPRSFDPELLALWRVPVRRDGTD